MACSQLMDPKQLMNKLDTNHFDAAKKAAYKFYSLALARGNVDSIVSICEAPFFWYEQKDENILTLDKLKTKFTMIFEDDKAVSPQFYIDTVYIDMGVKIISKAITPNTVAVTFISKYNLAGEGGSEQKIKVTFFVTELKPAKIVGVMETK